MKTNYSLLIGKGFLMRCEKCGIELNENTAYEYRNVTFCENHLDEGRESVEWQRSEKKTRSDNELAFAKKLDLSSETVVGKVNQEILADKINQYKKSIQDREW